MICYFSGTGNSKYIAENLAEMLNIKALDISRDELTENIKKEIIEGEYFGIVCPIYAWGLPEPVENFIKKLPESKAFKFVVCSCGMSSGLAVKKALKGVSGQSAYTILMPSNYIIGGDIEEEKVILEKLTNCDKEIEKVFREIKEKIPTYRVREGSLPRIKSSIVNMGFNKFARSTKPFYATSKCISCGLCQFVCPAKTISIPKKFPQWEEKCYQCMACISRCPQKSIEYGKKTRSKGRYYIENYKK